MENFLKQLTIEEIQALVEQPTEQVVSLMLEYVKHQEMGNNSIISGLVVVEEEDDCLAKNVDDAIYAFEQSVQENTRPDQVSHYIHQLKENLNMLIIVSKHPNQYEALLDDLYMETGLIGSVVEELGEVYSKGICVILDLRGKVVIKHRTLPQHAIYIDMYSQKEMERVISIKRPDITYISLMKFLDSERKTRYNTLVNEGNVNQRMNRGNKWLQKLFGRYRKRGKKDGN